MSEQFILAFDQSTSTTKALLFDQKGALKGRSDVPHRQIINDQGWVEHDAEQIIKNLFSAAKNLLKTTAVDLSLIKAVAISNQRETAVAWDRNSGKPFYHAIVWQCGRAKDICTALEKDKDEIHRRTGLHLSPYFSAAKFAWMLQNVKTVREAAQAGNLVLSTMDSYVLYHLSSEKAVRSEYSNASRTQLLNITDLTWDEKVASLFGIPTESLPELCDSNALFGHTDLGGILPEEVPIHAMLGDSQGALYAQGCHFNGMTKATYGTGSSIMMNIGQVPVLCEDLVTSLAWGIDGKVTYVLEGNINYSGATISYLVEDLELIGSAKEAGILAGQAKDIEGLYMVPAFSGLGAPYWDPEARAVIVGLDRRCKKAELVRAAEESIAYQIADIVFLMHKHAKQDITSLRVDGGPTNDSFLMQAQSNIIGCEVRVAALEELSGQGPALIAAKAVGILQEEQLPAKALYQPMMSDTEREKRYKGWKKAVSKALSS
ncbi:MAG: glycerol kinase GlpK [Sphaerochaeta sp.]|nr:glycerol kinase GlpK [Sphaerochaeta sp.]